MRVSCAWVSGRFVLGLINRFWPEPTPCITLLEAGSAKALVVLLEVVLMLFGK